ncbi:hypothetical protein OG426_44310 [Streptomyces canus]|uniref:RHS repeat-associated core domain-containing protein n=1 Tax=Streptomyces canus TaxID=58343 RepID=UPI002256537A|nr:RHS repeat-associated core domain-containing protein [Streptomyces canus]MCX4855667.1 hypothetical protein [Streptomyces canus]WSW38964.1 hypothetical protein OG426_44310 [Streptomyces canus]
MPNTANFPANLSGQSTSHVYDADGNLLIRRNTSGETVLYLGGTEVHLDTSTTTARYWAQRYYSAGSTTIALRTNKSGTQTLSYLSGDPHGTSTVSLDATTQAIAKRYLTPFGSSRTGGTGAWADDKTFLGKTTDSTSGLTYIGAREYDPAIGRFISVDPLLETDKHQTLNGYTYSANNPATFSDPTGEGLACGDGFDVGCGNNVVTDSGGTLSKDGKKNGGGVRPVTRTVKVAVAPVVENSRLRSILSDIYMKPGAIPEGDNDGKVATALLNELKTGEPTKGLWHVADASDLLTRLIKLLEEDRKPDKPVSLSESDRTVAISEAEEIWGALNTKDEAGVVTKLMTDNREVYNSVKAAGERMWRAPSMKSITGAEYEANPPAASRDSKVNPGSPKCLQGRAR